MPSELSFGMKYLSMLEFAPVRSKVQVPVLPLALPSQKWHWVIFVSQECEECGRLLETFRSHQLPVIAIKALDENHLGLKAWQERYPTYLWYEDIEGRVFEAFGALRVPGVWILDEEGWILGFRNGTHTLTLQHLQKVESLWKHMEIYRKSKSSEVSSSHDWLMEEQVEFWQNFDTSSFHFRGVFWLALLLVVCYAMYCILKRTFKKKRKTAFFACLECKKQIR